MKLLMLCQEDLGPIQKSGVLKKIFGQARAFQAHGFEVAILYVYRKQLTFKASLEAPETILCPARNLFEISYCFFQQAMRIVKRFQPDALYIRSAFAEPNYLGFLKKNRALKVACYCEFTTYPYDQEYRHKPLYKRLLLLVDKYYRRRLHNYIQHAFTYTDYSSIFGIPATCIENGINVQTVLLRTPQEYKPESCTLLGVANVSFWHGYDRIIEGLKHYYSSKDPIKRINFVIIGGGGELPKLRKLVETYGLQQYVHFAGEKHGNELYQYYNEADIGIGSLAMHRLKLAQGATLKTREYCAAGLPFVYAYHDNDFPDDFLYTLKIEANDSPVDIFQLLEFYEQLSRQNYITAMREYATTHLDWSVKLQPVVDTMQRLAGQGIR